MVQTIEPGIREAAFGPVMLRGPAAGLEARSAALLTCLGLVKSFGAVKALRGVDFEVRPGRVRGLVGENGAGKSTLVKIVAGVHQPDEGTIDFGGRPTRFGGADEAIARGVVTVHQDINLVQTMTVAENLLLNNEPVNRFGVVRRRAMAETASQLLRQYAVDVDPESPVAGLPNDLKKMVQIVKGVALRPKILILDEPTSSLTDAEVHVALDLIRKLAADGVGVVLISHYLNEIFAVCDDLTVMRDGKVVADGAVSQTSLPEVVTAMVGRHVETSRRVGSKPKPFAVPLMQVENLGVAGRPGGANFALGHGEVLGITGLAGSGLSELAKAIFGVPGAGRAGGQVMVEGKPVPPGDPAASLKAGVALITGDRRREGLLLESSLADNICLPILSRFVGLAGRLDRRAMTDTAQRNIDRLRVRAPGPEAFTSQLSGGNQQKVLFAKWLEASPKVFVMEDPTIGIDVGSKDEIRAIIDEIAREGVGIVLITTELEELVTLCDRVLVMFRGAFVAEMTGAAIAREKILHAAACGEELAVGA